ncbi:Glycosyl transferase family 41 [Enhydrobacter aerosaccus]|uniref:Glycosyl transferase family 41 n=1 Tax=Enhydrobacter aerosaccus TaxID=225324 RepID=A0A1T4TBB5_9HYPH|nr:glycosyltransferase [Enhydrobacter aerosaccus]SKA37860.1 Glycosyl transferase family 41 [Enhydrobacter aerosaccus]
MEIRQDKVEQPLVSVICFCKDRVAFLPRSVESVLSQSYRNIELVVQDGASTDGTLELLQSYAQRDPRVKIVSEPDSGPAEAYWKVLQRCTGAYIATCLSDEELQPGVIEEAVRWFAEQPQVGAFTCDGYTTDSDGKIIGEFKAGDFDFVAYIFDRYCPFWPGSFFRRKALLDVGLDQPGWNIGCLEFEIWCRLARDHVVRYVPTPVSKYAIHPGQLSNTPKNFHEHIDNRLKLIEGMFSEDGFFGAGKLKDRLGNFDPEWGVRQDHWFREIEAKISQLSQFEAHARAHKLEAEEKGFARRIEDLKQQAIAYHEQNVKAFKYSDRQPGITDAEWRRSLLDELWKGWEATLGVPHLARPKDRGLRWRLWLQRFVTERFLIDREHPLRRALDLAARLGLAEEACEEFKSFATARRAERRFRLYDSVARIYESRGQIDEALAMWGRAEPLHDPLIETAACQAAIKQPGATNEELAVRHQRWADRHARVDPAIPRPSFEAFDGRRRLRIGYHCSFMDADTIRYIMARAFRAHDRGRVEVFGYAPMDLPQDIGSGFDVSRNTGRLSDEDFLAVVRADKIDVFIELSGFSPGHRFRAMANRCAPVQVSYLNHFATSRVPNVDYILSDETCTPSDSDVQRHFSETIFRFADCLLCYDYAEAGCPPVGPLPALTAKAVTFACLGSGGKINPSLAELWAAILHRVPNSSLLLQNGQLSLADNRRYVERLFRRFGIGAERLKLRPGTNRDGVMKTYAEVDISLDTVPYCGGNTVAESLWQGVPVVTLKGELFTGRYGASLLAAARCPELIAETPERYIEIACDLASNLDRLASLRADLRRRYVEGGLNDSKRFARSLEQAYLSMIAEARNVGSAALTQNRS